MAFLPVTKEEMKDRGWDCPDFVYVTGDAYVDQSSFGSAIISRVLEAAGFRVAMLPQPDFRDSKSVTRFGRPRLGFLVTAGNMDSMVNHYTVNKKPRSKDAYSPGGQRGLRPDRATIVYCNLIRREYGRIPIIIGGIEASLRRLTHYDYWSDRLKRSILLDSGADLLIYGMGELAVVQAARALEEGKSIEELRDIPGTCRKAREIDDLPDVVLLPSHEEQLADRLKYAESYGIQYRNTDFATGKRLAESYGEHRYVVQNPPMRPLTMQEMDEVYGLPYMNEAHPSYDSKGGVPALEEVRFSVTSNRGCFGCCSFCALSFHQGRVVQARSHGSILAEAVRMTKDAHFKGYIHDVGGPTADFRRPACRKQSTKGACPDRQCLFPAPCQNLEADHGDYLELLRKLRSLPGVKKVFIRSGIRFDYVLADKNGDAFLREIARYHVSGQLRVAPEHVSERVLKLMGKPGSSVYLDFKRRFEKINQEMGLQQYVVPYLISSHPGSELADAVALAESIRDMGYMPEQVQDFYPTPSTISTCMYYSGVDPRAMKPVHTVTDPHEKRLQRALMQYRLPENHALVKEALVKAGREDLIGFDKKRCLIPPRISAADKGKAAGGAGGSARRGAEAAKGSKPRNGEKKGRTGKVQKNRERSVSKKAGR